MLQQFISFYSILSGFCGYSEYKGDTFQQIKKSMQETHDTAGHVKMRFIIWYRYNGYFIKKLLRIVKEMFTL